MPEWLIERGIGETRAALVDAGEIIEARIQLEGSVPAGSVIAARVLSTGTSGRNAVAIAEGGVEYLLPNGAPGATQGVDNHRRSHARSHSRLRAVEEAAGEGESGRRLPCGRR